jgi:hypothetical protein
VTYVRKEYDGLLYLFYHARCLTKSSPRSAASWRATSRERLAHSVVHCCPPVPKVSHHTSIHEMKESLRHMASPTLRTLLPQLLYYPDMCTRVTDNPPQHFWDAGGGNGRIFWARCEQSSIFLGSVRSCPYQSVYDPRRLRITSATRDAGGGNGCLVGARCDQSSRHFNGL